MARCANEFPTRLAKPSGPRPHSVGELIASLNSALSTVFISGAFQISLSRKSRRWLASCPQTDPAIRDTPQIATKSLRIGVPVIRHAERHSHATYRTDVAPALVPA